MRTVCFVAILTLFVAGCTPAEDPVSGEGESSEPVVSAVEEPPTGLADEDVFLSCAELENEFQPLHEIMLHLGDISVKVGMSAACEMLTSEHHGIPETALSAAGGYYAGAGDYYYLERDGEDFVVKVTYDEEPTGETDGVRADPANALVVAKYSSTGEELQAPIPSPYDTE